MVWRSNWDGDGRVREGDGVGSGWGWNLWLNVHTLSVQVMFVVISPKEGMEHAASKVLVGVWGWDTLLWWKSGVVEGLSEWPWPSLGRWSQNLLLQEWFWWPDSWFRFQVEISSKTNPVRFKDIKLNRECISWRWNSAQTVLVGWNEDDERNWLILNCPENWHKR